MSTSVLHSAKFNALVHNTVYSYLASSPEALPVAFEPQGTRFIIILMHSVNSVTKDHWMKLFLSTGGQGYSDNKTIQSQKITE